MKYALPLKLKVKVKRLKTIWTSYVLPFSWSHAFFSIIIESLPKGIIWHRKRHTSNKIGFLKFPWSNLCCLAMIVVTFILPEMIKYLFDNSFSGIYLMVLFFPYPFPSPSSYQCHHKTYSRITYKVYFFSLIISFFMLGIFVVGDVGGFFCLFWFVFFNEKICLLFISLKEFLHKGVPKDFFL